MVVGVAVGTNVGGKSPQVLLEAHIWAFTVTSRSGFSDADRRICDMLSGTPHGAVERIALINLAPAVGTSLEKEISSSIVFSRSCSNGS